MSYASLKKSSLRSFATSSPARRTSLAVLLVTRKPLSQGGRGGGAVSCAARSLGMPMPCVVMVLKRCLCGVVAFDEFRCRGSVLTRSFSQSRADWPRGRFGEPADFLGQQTLVDGRLSASL